MGKDDDPQAVIDSRARVRGVTGLRVVDASAFPVLPPGHPSAAVCESSPYSFPPPPLLPSPSLCLPPLSLFRSHNLSSTMYWREKMFLTARLIDETRPRH